ncbi:FadR/GntR family transcriptional regulator [Ralstonia soli]|uniref:GntR family transcriptional regulator n=1 Tax=Ralstonia soli TaxID=2953896 RepID=A0ABT1AEF4_9RALS|nr:GntR family transcriptional regulator [Ralstonia soli]MCO5396693.1 GntR family transcriptional regulator [Ralstonia soli]
MFAPIGALSGVAGIVARLRTAIDLGFLEDGELLPKEAALAGQLRVSAFALREALAELRAEGLVETRPGRGGGTLVRRRSTVVHQNALRLLCDMSSVSLRDLADWRGMLLSECAGLAARRSSAANRRRLFEYAKSIRGAKTLTDASRAHARFDVELASAAQSVRLTSALLEIYEKYAWLFGLAHEDEKYRTGAQRTLQQITESLEARDEQRATSLARSLASETFDYLVRLRLQAIAEQAV